MHIKNYLLMFNTRLNFKRTAIALIQNGKKTHVMKAEVLKMLMSAISPLKLKLPNVTTTSEY